MPVEIKYFRIINQRPNSGQTCISLHTEHYGRTFFITICILPNTVHVRSYFLLFLVRVYCTFSPTIWLPFRYVQRTYLLTPWCRVLLEKLTGLQLVKKFPTFYGTRRFITALKTVRHLSLSWASPIQSIYPHPTSWRSILILSTHLRVGTFRGLPPNM